MITVIINGQSFDYPEVGDTDWGNAATIAFQSLVATTLQKSASSFTLENELDFGGANGIKVLFISTRSNDPALSGVFRLSNGELVSWRNGNNDDDNTLSFDASDNFVINGNTISFDVNGEMLVNGVQVTRSGEIVNADVADSAGIVETKLALDYSTQSLYDNIENHKADVNNPHSVTKSQVLTGDLIVNADVDASAAIEESKLDLDYGTSALNTNIENHKADTNNPHVVTKSQVLSGNPIVNADVDASAAIEESKLDLNYGTSALNTNIENHKADTNNPHSTTVANLTDTTITSAASGDVLSYDGSKWVNAPSSSASLSGLSDTDITTPANGDTLVYNNVSTKWENSDQLSTLDSTVTTHVGSTSNPHSTSVSNLTDTSLSGLNAGDVLVYDGVSEWNNQLNELSNIVDTGIISPANGDALVYDGNLWINRENSVYNLTDTVINSATDGDILVYDSNDNVWNNLENSIDNLSNVDIDSNTETENDVLVYDDVNQKWINSQILVNHIGNASNPHLTTVSKLTDTTITTPANGDVLYYDYANSQWINFSIAGVINNFWITSTSYSVGDIVNYAGRTYKCVVAHTSSSGFETDYYAGKWDDGNVAGTIIQNLASSVPYHYFDVTGNDAGAEISKTTYASLYAVIGDTYATCYNYSGGSQYSAPASGNFRLPDFRDTYFKNSGALTWGAGHNASHTHKYNGSNTVDLSHSHSIYGGNVPVTNSPTSVGSIKIPLKNSVIANPAEAYAALGVQSGYSGLLSSSTNPTTLTVPALDSSGSGSSPEPNYYGTKIFLKY